MKPYFLQEEEWGFSFNDYFLKSGFWHFPSERNSSNGNQLLLAGKRDNWERQLYP